MTEFDEESFKEKILPIISTPFLISLIGHPERKDFLYVSTEKKGVPLPFWWNSEGGKQQLMDEPIKGLAALHHKKPFVAFKKDKGGTEDYSVQLLDFSENGGVKQITKDTIGDISDIFWIDDECLLIIGFNEEHYYVKKINLSGQMIDLFTTDEQILNTHFDQKGMLLAAAVGRRYTRIAIIDIKETKVQQWVSQSEDSSSNFPAFSTTGQLAYATDQPKAHDEIIIQSVKNPEEQKRFAVPGFAGFWPFDQGALQWIGEDKLLVKVGKNAHVSLYLLDINQNNWSEITPKELSISNAIVTSDGIVWVGSSLKRPQTIQKYMNGKNIKLFEMGDKLLNISIESHWYESFDGQKIQGWLIKSPDPEAPLLVYCHGGPTYAVTNDWEPFLLSFVLAGFHVFAPNFRGSTTFGSEFKDLNIGEFGRGDLKDVLYGAKYAKKLLKKERLPLIFGASHGGFLTLRALTTQPEEWLGGAAWVPMADLVEAYELANSHYRAFLRHFLGGSPDEKKEIYEEFSPITHLENLKAPLLIYHGVNDPRCPVISVRRFYEEAQKRTLPVELIVAGDEGHGSLEVEGIVGALQLSVKHLQSIL
ncbi:MAG: alpha/beta fold hydrolase [Candidatus Heimdallarchaeota archaeon]|nr:alpha/beta fold hydrolase [Candidatus Heimdallarchaeota archaeon]